MDFEGCFDSEFDGGFSIYLAPVKFYFEFDGGFGNIMILRVAMVTFLFGFEDVFNENFEFEGGFGNILI